jgi:hypothetical protein
MDGGSSRSAGRPFFVMSRKPTVRTVRKNTKLETKAKKVKMLGGW